MGKLATAGTQDTHLKNGIRKITEANSLVDKLKEEAKRDRKELSEKQALADKALEQITSVVQQASIQKSEAEKLRPFLVEEEAKIKDKKELVKVQLSEIEPIMAAAKANMS